MAFLRSTGVQCVVTNGTTSEFSGLTLAERRLILEFVRKEFEGIILNHIGSCCTQDCANLLDHSSSYADAVLAMPPFFFGQVSEEGVKEFWRQIFPASAVPIFLYNFPEHTQFNCRADFAAQVAAEFDLVRGIKDSGADFQLSIEFRQVRETFDVFVGSEGRTVDALRHGLNGAVCGLGNALPELQLAIHHSFRSGLIERAGELQLCYNEWLEFRRRHSLNPSELVKAGIAARLPGFPTAVRPPLLPLDRTICEAVVGVISNVLGNYGQVLSSGYT